jgi:hypothetical protein
MAQITGTRGLGGGKFTINATGLYILGDVDESFAATFELMLVSNSFSGSITVQAYSKAKAADDDGVTPVPISYVGSYVNGSVGTDAFVSTAITGTSEILVPATGRRIVLDCTAYTSGSMTVYAVPIIGAG